MDSRPFVTPLKNALKLRGLGYTDIAKEMNVSLSTVKRWFSSGGMSLDQFAKILALGGIGLHDLANLMGSAAESEVYFFSEEQEIFFIKNPVTHAFFNALLKYGSVRKIAKAKALNDAVVMKCLNQLHKLELIEWKTGTQYRLLVSAKIGWRRDGPLRRQFFTEAKTEFLNSNFSERQSDFRFLYAPLTEKSASELLRQISKITTETMHISEVEGSANPHLQEYGILLAVRPWTFSKLSL